jgi:hypothetical protein
MTDEEMKQQIETSANAERAAGSTIEINHNLPYVAIDMGGESQYFLQGQEASELIDEHELRASKFNVSVEDSILHSAQGW